MNRIVGCTVLALALVIVPTGSAVLAQTASVSPSASPGTSPSAVTHACDLWTADEVSAALGGGEFTVQPASSGAPICFYGGTETAGDLTESLYAGLIFGDASTGSLIDSVRQNLPDAEELELGGMVAIPGPTSAGVYLHSGPGSLGAAVFPVDRLSWLPTISA